MVKDSIGKWAEESIGKGIELASHSILDTHLEIEGGIEQAIENSLTNININDAAIWMIEPRRLSELCGKDRCIRSTNNDSHLKKIKNYINLEGVEVSGLPLPIIPDFVSPRIVSQFGRFTLHTHHRGGIQKFAQEAFESDKHNTPYVVKIIIPHKCHIEILRSLRVAGLSPITLQQDLDGVVEELLWRMRLGQDDRTHGHN